MTRNPPRLPQRASFMAAMVPDELLQAGEDIMEGAGGVRKLR